MRFTVSRLRTGYNFLTLDRPRIIPVFISWHATDGHRMSHRNAPSRRWCFPCKSPNPIILTSYSQRWRTNRAGGWEQQRKSSFLVNFSDLHPRCIRGRIREWPGACRLLHRRIANHHFLRTLLSVMPNPALRILAQHYPTVSSAASEVAALRATKELPKGVIHVISDIHGENQKLRHVITSRRMKCRT
jgi:hypothetical protein